jgi:23S rRNA (uridine2552-2'-O)-methyltransferase
VKAESTAANFAAAVAIVPIYQPRDKFYRKARDMGLPSRAAFKLEELLARYRLLKRDARILDLGCAPGGWLVILAAAAPQGTVVGIDLEPCRAPERVRVLTGDVREPDVQEAVIAALGGPANLVTSDMAPKLSGIRSADEARTLELLEIAANLAEGVLKPQGALIAKVFMSEELRHFQAGLRKRFESVELVHTQASRPGSRELYLVARGFHPATKSNPS